MTQTFLKRVLFIITFVAVGSMSNATAVSDSIAKIVAISFLNNKAVNPIGTINSTGLKLAYTAKAVIRMDGTGLTSKNLFYIFNIDDDKGFIIITSDDAALPVPGYSFNGGFDSSKLNLGLWEWLDNYRNQIQYNLENNVLPTENIKVEWSNLIRNINLKKRMPLQNVQTSNALPSTSSPLLKTLWAQNPSSYIYTTYPTVNVGYAGAYNNKCPYDNVANGRCVTGCVATAMAQILKFWNYPSQGSGFHSYTPYNAALGIQSVNFAGTTYQWGLMPDSLTTNAPSNQVNAVATLMYHCGVSVNMDYGVSSSGAYVIDSGSPTPNTAEYALKTYFGYDSIMGVSRYYYTDSAWISMLQNEISNGRPVIHDGRRTNGGHCFIADGYDANNMFHFNWGWSGYANGYFQINSLNPLGGTGYNTGQEAIINIKPPPPPPAVIKLSLYNHSVVTSADSVVYGTAFSVTTNIMNTGNTTFLGDVCAAVFDSTGNFITYMSKDSGISVSVSGTFNNATFSAKDTNGILPGKYSISIYYRTNGGNWIKMSDSSTYINKANIIITNKNNISLITAFVINSYVGKLLSGKPSSISTNVRNDGTGLFTGKYLLALYNLNGTFNSLLGDTITDNVGILPGNIYPNSLTFTTNTIAAVPGSYLMALLYQPAGGKWNWVSNNGNFKNPVNINVEIPPLIPDQYEPNDSVSQSYLLPSVFVGDSAYISTSDVNIHSDIDQDFYKINLPSGYSYTIKPNLNDFYLSNNKSYTLKGMFSYSVDSINWSVTYNDTMPGSIFIPNGATLFLHVSPNYAGETGTYLLEANIKRILLPTPDQYEPNDSIGQSYLLPINFSNDTAHVNTVGANIHSSTDQDYYKIKLPAGYNYIIKPDLNDFYLSNNLSYSLKGKFSYSLDSINWTGDYNDTMPGFINVSGGNTLFIHISPNYFGATGTYLFEVNIKRTLPPQPDKYEPNDSISQSYLLSLSFINDSAYINTAGSSIHVSIDQDYYKINLPVGYSYIIKPNLNDYYLSNNLSYTLKGKFSYSTDSVNWKGSYIDTMPSYIYVLGGTTLFLHVSPNNPGETGTYLLEVNIVRIPPPSPDSFEPNDSISQSYPLTVTFVNDSSYINTVGANISSSADQDYYKISLPAWYNYTIKPSLNLSNNRNYFFKGMFSYSVDSINWSAIYTDTIPGNIKLANGGTIYFHVASNNIGTTGYYQLGVNIKRIVIPKVVKLSLYNQQLVPSSDTINYGSIFSVSTSLINIGNSAFKGDYCAAVYDNNGTLINYYSIDTGQTLNANGILSNATFSAGGLYRLVPGTYTVSLFYRFTGGNWLIVPNNGTYINKAKIVIVNRNPIALFKPINITSGPLITGKPSSISLNIRNNGTTLFTGYYLLCLYNMDGSFAYYMGGYIYDSKGIHPTYVYSTDLVFTTTAIPAPPGTYLMALVYEPVGGNSWSWAGTGNYQNPLIVNIGDKYETNDSVSQSYLLPTGYVGDSAYVITAGSNIHSNTDQDYYKISLPSGYNYTINPVLNNYYFKSSGDSNYTSKAVLSYSSDSINWSSNFSDAMPGNITVTGGSTFFFHVAPKDVGDTGTYLLELNIKRFIPFVNGNIVTPLGKPIPNVYIHFKSSQIDTSIINSGNFSATLLGSNDSLRPYKNNDKLKTNGVTVIDIAYIQNHILNKSNLNSPYKIIAADVNGDGKVSPLDISYIKRFILNLDTTFIKTSTGEKRLWTFVDSSYTFIKPNLPFPVKDNISYNVISPNLPNQTFIGCKLGDVDWSWNPAKARAGFTNSINDIELSYPKNISKSMDGLIHIPVLVKNFKEILGAQFTISFDYNNLTFKGIADNNLNIETNATKAGKGSLSFLWIDPNNAIKTLDDGAKLMELVFEPVAGQGDNNSLINALDINGSITDVAAYDKDFAFHNITLNTYTQNQKTTSKELYTVIPNPVTNGKVNIQMKLYENKPVILRLTDINGKLLIEKKVDGVVGDNQIILKPNTLIKPGIYYLKADGIDGESTKVIMVGE